MKYTRIQRKRWKKRILIRQWIEDELFNLGYCYSSSDENYWYFSNEDDTTIRISHNFKSIMKSQTDYDIEANITECPVAFTDKEFKILYKGVK